MSNESKWRSDTQERLAGEKTDGLQRLRRACATELKISRYCSYCTNVRILWINLLHKTNIEECRSCQHLFVCLGQGFHK